MLSYEGVLATADVEVAGAKAKVVAIDAGLRQSAAGARLRFFYYSSVRLVESSQLHLQSKSKHNSATKQRC